MLRVRRREDGLDGGAGLVWGSYYGNLSLGLGNVDKSKRIRTGSRVFLPCSEVFFEIVRDRTKKSSALEKLGRSNALMDGLFGEPHRQPMFPSFG